MHTGWLPFGLALCLLHLFNSVSSPAQSLDPSLRVETDNSQITFHIGERIPLRLSFFYAEGVPVLVGREPCAIRSCVIFSKPEAFDIQPAKGWSDPLATYFAQRFILTGGGDPSPPPSKPLQVRLDLNEWVRFDEPGDYTVRITSHRIESISTVRVGAVSATIRLHIIPASPEWQDARLQWIRSIRDPYKPEWFDAQEDLRYLATPSAVEEMVSRLREEHGPSSTIYDCVECMGIIGLPEPMRKIAIASMDHRIEEPDFPVSPVFIDTMTFLRGGETCRGELRLECPYDAVLWLKVDAALPKKRDEARKETLRTLNQAGSYLEDSRVKTRMRSLPRLTWPAPD
jgi:hypothetical protein